MEISRKLRAFAVAGGIVALLLGTAVTPATAKPLVREHVQVSGSEVIVDCGLTLRVDRDFTLTSLFNPRGPGGSSTPWTPCTARSR